jgi:hypothetical protein
MKEKFFVPLKKGAEYAKHLFGFSAVETRDSKLKFEKNGFKPGYVFGEKAIVESKHYYDPSNRIRRTTYEFPWPNWETPLEDYAKKIMNLEAYLEIQAEKYRNSGTKIRILDVGIGGGKQWTPFLKRNSVEFAGTTLTKFEYDMIPKKIQNMVRICMASDLAAIWPQGSFDMVVSHLGIHEQQLQAFENILYILSIGGEAVIGSADFPISDMQNANGKLFEMRNAMPLEGSQCNYYWVRKLQAV